MVVDFQVSAQEKDGVSVIHVTGEVDLHTCPRLHAVMQEVMKNESKNCVLNLTDIQYIDSTGLGVVAHSAKSLGQEGGALAIVCTKSQIRKVFELSGLDKKVHLFDLESTAVESFR